MPKVLYTRAGQLVSDVSSITKGGSCSGLREALLSGNGSPLATLSESFFLSYHAYHLHSLTLSLRCGTIDDTQSYRCNFLQHQQGRREMKRVNYPLSIEAAL